MKGQRTASEHDTRNRDEEQGACFPQEKVLPNVIVIYTGKVSKLSLLVLSRKRCGYSTI